MKYIFLICLLGAAWIAQGQIVNSMSPDKSGIYFYCVDSVMSYLKGESGIASVFIKGKTGEKIDKFPLVIHDIEVRNLDCQVDCVRNLKEGDVLITLSGISIIRDRYSVSVKVQQKKKRKLERFADYGYFFQFRFLPESKTYELRKFHKGIVL